MGSSLLQKVVSAELVVVLGEGLEEHFCFHTFLMLSNRFLKWNQK